MNVENIRKVRDRIASLRPEQFDMGESPFADVAGPDCGCISTWAQRVLGETEAYDAFSAVSVDDYARLVMPPGWATPGRYTIADAVAVLDGLIATGRVKWPTPEPSATAEPSPTPANTQADRKGAT